MNQDENQKNLLLAIVLSIMVLAGWQMLFVSPKIKDERDRAAREAATQQGPQTPGTIPGAGPAGAPQQAGAPPATGPATSVPGAGPGALSPPRSAVVMSREEALAATKRVALKSPGLTGSISLKGGRIDDVRLVRYREKADPTSPSVVLLSPSGSPEPYYAEFSWFAPAGVQVKPPDWATDWKVESGTELTPTTPVTLIYEDGLGHVFRRKVSLDNNYMFTIVDSVENKGQAPTTLSHRALIARHGTPKIEGFYIQHEGPIGVIGEKGLQEITYADTLKGLKDGGRLEKPFLKSTGGWLGITDKYWATALVPDQKLSLDAYVIGHAKTGGAKESYEIDYLANGLQVAPQATQTVTMNFFAGAKRVDVIEGYERDLGIKQFDLLIDWGWFHFITKPLFKLIDWLASFFAKLGLASHFGLAILATTVLVKAAFFPLANKSYESMAKMKKLQPEMEKLRERYKDDRVRQQQELMALYQKEKINPMAGCLPVLLQIPVFFALYKVLFVSLDMRHAPFYGWIKDLSAPDPTTIFNLFGLLPFAVPEFLHVGLWPIIMGITMWLQMQLNPQQPDPIQQQIFNWMPVMFTFMLASFPVGLVIYWAWSNILSLIQQYHINKRNGAEIHLWRNIGIDRLTGRGKEPKP